MGINRWKTGDRRPGTEVSFYRKPSTVYLVPAQKEYPYWACPVGEVLIGVKTALEGNSGLRSPVFGLKHATEQLQ